MTGVVAAFVVVAFAFGGSHGAPIGAYTTDGTYSYVTEPALRPPVIRTDIKTASSKLAPGYILMTNFYDLSHPPMIGQSGPLILDNSLQPVWFKPVPTQRGRRQPQPPGLQRQAGAGVVAGRGHEHRRHRAAAST